MTGLRDRGQLGSWGGWGTPPTAPTVPEASAIQTTLPTSAYGQTIPVVWGKCRLPAAYIWVPPIATVTSTHTEWWDTITTTTSFMSCRLRFARPLVPNSTWTLRKLYSNGKLIYDASQGYRAKGLKFRAYDGRSSQPRDPTMTREEGTNNVSAHRGYLDIVLVDFDIQGIGAPPVFEAEWIENGATTHDYDTFTTYSAGGISFGDIVPVWDQSKLYGLEWNSSIFLYSIPATRQYFDFFLPADAFNYYGLLRYSRTLDRLFYLGSFTGSGGWLPVLLDGSTGALVGSSSDAAASSTMGGGCLLDVSGGALVLGFAGNQQIFVYLIGTDDSVTRTYQSTASWSGYASLQCVTPGENRGSEADVYLCADGDLVKVTLTGTGVIKLTSVLSSFSDDLRYAVYDDDGDLVVWTDAATVSRVNGTTGALEYTKTVPYQIEDYATRDLGDPDLQRLTDELYFTTGGVSYFTDLKTGATRQISGANSAVSAFVYDGQTDTVLTVGATGKPVRLRIIASDGEHRLLSDFLTDLMVHGGGFDQSEVETINIDDVIDGAVIDITAGARDVARATCDPYSIAIFERSGQIIFKRALTDGSFAVDASISSAGDMTDQ